MTENFNIISESGALFDAKKSCIISWFSSSLSNVAHTTEQNPLQPMDLSLDWMDWSQISADLVKLIMGKLIQRY